MEKRKREGLSLRWGVSSAVVLCWVIPIVTIVLVAGFLLKHNYEKDLRQTVVAETEHAMKQMELRVEAVLESSKAVSYDGDIREAYRNYCASGDRVELYRKVTDYLTDSYSRDENFQAVFIAFLDQPKRDYSYVRAKGVTSFSISEHYRKEVRDEVLTLAAGMDTGIVFVERGGQIYLVRNLLNNEFQPYAVLAMLCDAERVSRPLEGISNLASARVTVDDLTVDLSEQLCDGTACSRKGPAVPVEYTVDASGHSLTFEGRAVGETLWGAIPGLEWVILVLLLLLLPVLALVIGLFYLHVSQPLDILVAAASRVQSGERGYQIEEKPRNREFQKLTNHFNSMSVELKTQFDQIYLEQQALQEARIRALQSQINPHFLGNTLEIINWEARLAGDEKVGTMIEALSTMMDAAIGRDGRSRISLREELKYVDAYLYIIRERIGEGLQITKEIDEDLLECIVPRLLLQPLVENAIEHDLSKTHGGALCIRAHRKDDRIHMEVEHEGHIGLEDQEKLRQILSGGAGEEHDKGHVGLRNLCQRVRLIYGDRAEVAVQEILPGRVNAWVEIPVQLANRCGK